MVVEQRPSERGVAKAKAEAWVQPKMVVGLSRGGDVVAEPWLKPKNNGSLIPPRRKLVKRMMLDSIVRFIASMFGAQRSPTSSGAPITPGASGHLMIVPPANPNREKNVRKILPHPR